MKQFFSQKKALIYYHPELDAYFLEYTDEVDSHYEFVEINRAALNAFTRHRTTKFVTDTRKINNISIESQKWVFDHILPNMQKYLSEKRLVYIQLVNQNQSEIFSTHARRQRRDRSFEVNGIRVFPFTDEAEMKEYLKALKKLTL